MLALMPLRGADAVSREASATPLPPSRVARDERGRRSWRILAVLCAVCLSAVATGAADASIIESGAAPATISDTRCETARWTWSLDLDKQETGTNRCAPNWTIVPKSPPQTGSEFKKLEFEVQHLPPPPDTTDTPKNPADPLTIDAGFYKQEGNKKQAGLYVIPHPDGHRDMYRWSVDTTDTPIVIDNAIIEASAIHSGDKLGMRWSYTPDTNDQKIKSVTASYPTDLKRVITNLPTDKLDRGKKVEGDLKPSAIKKEPPSDYEVRVEIGDPYFTDTTLAFIAGEEGSYTHAELALATQFFTGDLEFFVPMLFDANGLLDLYVAVDLTQWLSFPVTFSSGDVFEFVDGVGALPGIQVATSPFRLDSVLGHVSDNPATVATIVLGTIDGHTVPEPPILALLVAGLLLLAPIRRTGAKISPRMVTCQARAGRQHSNQFSCVQCQ